MENLIFEEKTCTIFRVLIKNVVKKCWVKEEFWVRLSFSSEKNSCRPTEVEGEDFWCSVRTFGWFVRTAFYVSVWDFWVNCFFCEIQSFFIVFRLWEEHSATLAQNLWESCQRCILLDQQTFRGKFVFWRKYSLLEIFRVLIKNSLDFCRKTFHLVWELAFYTRSGGLLA